MKVKRWIFALLFVSVMASGIRASAQVANKSHALGEQGLIGSVYLTYSKLASLRHYYTWECAVGTAPFSTGDNVEAMYGTTKTGREGYKQLTSNGVTVRLKGTDTYMSKKGGSYGQIKEKGTSYVYLVMY